MHGLIWREDRHYVAMDNNSEWSSEKGRRKEEWMKAVGNIHSYPPRRKQYPKLQLVRGRIAGKEDERGGKEIHTCTKWGRKYSVRPEGNRIKCCHPEGILTRSF